MKDNVNIGLAPDDGTGDVLRDAFEKVNKNTTELYNLMPDNYVGRDAINAEMEDGYDPFNEQDVATKSYVDDLVFGEVDQLNDSKQSISEKSMPGGYSPLDVNARVPLKNLPPERTIPRHVFDTLAEMLAAAGKVHSGDVTLVTGDPDPFVNGEYVAGIDHPTHINKYWFTGDHVGTHRHEGPDVDVTTTAGKQTLQYYIDNLATSETPIGSITHWPTSTAPAGWLLCDGADFDPIVYKELSRILGGTNTPDLTGKFVRGASSSRTPFSVEDQETSRPTNPFRTELLGGHVHSITGGGHVHDLNVSDLGQNGDHLDRNSVAAGYYGNHSRNAGSKVMWNSGAGHGQHSHAMSNQGQHDHSIDRGGDSETRPENTALWYIIKGRDMQGANGIIPIRYEGVTVTGKNVIQLKEQTNTNIIVAVDGRLLPTSEYKLIGNTVELTNISVLGGRYVIINYSAAPNEPHHVFETVADMVAAHANIVLGELIFIHADPDATKDGEYIATKDNPTVEADFSHLGYTIRKHTHVGKDITGVIKPDGSVEMLGSYTPPNDASIATKKYVDDVKALSDIFADTKLIAARVYVNDKEVAIRKLINDTEVFLTASIAASEITTKKYVDNRHTIIPPTTDPKLPGALWNDRGTLRISA